MPDKAPLPKTLSDYVTHIIASLPSAARLVVVFDPYANLALGETLAIEETRRAWRVVRYDGNDLAFRQQLVGGPGESDLIWVTAAPDSGPARRPQIQLHSLMDIWRRAESFIDASLPGILHQLAPSETWPVEPVWEHAEILGQNLPAVITGLKTLRRWMGRHTALDAHTIRALALHCLQPDLPPQRFLFREDTPGGVLDSYLELLWGTDWQAKNLDLLQTQAREAPRLNLGEVEAWLNISPPAMALYLYLRRVLGQFRIPNVANQLRGLGLFNLDPDVLEAHVGSALARWDRDPAWRGRLICQAETDLTIDDVNRVVSLLDLDPPDKAFEALSRADTPAMIYALQVEFFQRAVATKRVYRYSPTWAERRPLALGALPQTPFKERVLTLAVLYDEIAFIDVRRRLSPPSKADIASLLDWYVGNKLYDLEYAHARASSQLLYLPDEQLRNDFKLYLDFQKRKIKECLDDLDHRLARLITAKWSDYVSHSRLSTYALWDTVIRRRVHPTTQSRLWIVVFDGMRWDTWDRHVKPRLLETFEFVEDEKPYLSLLPSWTGVARTGLLAGKTPGGWRDYRHKFSRDQAQLAAILFDVPQREQSRQVQFFSNMESDRKYDQLDPNVRHPYNVLIYNISDDNLHHLKGSLLDLNKVVNSLLDDILQMLNNLIEPGDTLVVTSDHGFVELDEEDAIIVPDDRRWERYRSGAPHPVRYRYITTHQVPDDLPHTIKIEYPGLFDQYAVAVGRYWFKREDSRGKEDRYAHGGLSLSEMAVPGAVLKRITEKRIEGKLSVQPTKLEMTEGDTPELKLTVSNKGNVPLVGQLTAEADTASEPTIYSLGLAPGEALQIEHEVTAHYQKHGDGTIESTQAVKITFTYTDLAGNEKKLSRRVSVTVTPRTDVVEFDFGGLPDIEV
jgi:hypothetical protein